MKKLGTFRFALVYAGCFLGAGYVSGQELWQYFGAFGQRGYGGLGLAMLLLFAVGVITVRIACMTGFREADKIMVPWDIKPLRCCVSVLELIMLFTIFTIMTAGVGALAEQLFGLPCYVGSGVYSLLVLLMALLGLQGMVSAFSVSVPLLVGATLVFGVMTAVETGVPAPVPLAPDGNRLLGNWLVGAVNFACYNAFVTVAIIAPFGEHMKKRSTVYFGTGLGVVMLAAVAMSVLFTLNAMPAAVSAELPMLYAASTLSPGAAWVYALLLFSAMFGTSLSCFVSFVGYLGEKFPWIDRRRGIVSLVVCLCGFGGGLVGFGDLIGLMYPLFGYGSILFMVLMAVHMLKAKVGEKHSEMQTDK